jgi:hypothetical protein
MTSETVGPIDVVIVVNVPADIDTEPPYTKVYRYEFETLRDAEEYIKAGTEPKPGERFASGFLGGGQSAN